MILRINDNNDDFDHDSDGDDRDNNDDILYQRLIMVIFLPEQSLLPVQKGLRWSSWRSSRSDFEEEEQVIWNCIQNSPQYYSHLAAANISNKKSKSAPG